MTDLNTGRMLQFSSIHRYIITNTNHWCVDRFYSKVERNFAGWSDGLALITKVMPCQTPIYFCNRGGFSFKAKEVVPSTDKGKLLLEFVNIQSGPSSWVRSNTKRSGLECLLVGEWTEQTALWVERHSGHMLWWCFTAPHNCCIGYPPASEAEAAKNICKVNNCLLFLLG